MTYCCRATWERDDVSLEILDTANDVSTVMTPVLDSVSIRGEFNRNEGGAGGKVLS